jgi:hypothetical protein
LFKMAQRMELAVQFNITKRYSSSNFQSTNYGLGGVCDRHLDPFGYIEGKELGEGHEELKLTGDMIATMMGWLEDTEAGGGTAFTNSKQEFLVRPQRGALALWHNLVKYFLYFNFKSQNSKTGKKIYTIIYFFF